MTMYHDTFCAFWLIRFGFLFADGAHYFLSISHSIWHVMPNHCSFWVSTNKTRLHSLRKQVCSRQCRCRWRMKWYVLLPQLSVLARVLFFQPFFFFFLPSPHPPSPLLPWFANDGIGLFDRGLCEPNSAGWWTAWCVATTVTDTVWRCGMHLESGSSHQRECASCNIPHPHANLALLRACASSDRILIHHLAA